VIECGRLSARGCLTQIADKKKKILKIIWLLMHTLTLDTGFFWR
jgi:hypothetical protein